jgi:murein L,D-transpeptidase YcbB/YkuD
MQGSGVPGAARSRLSEPDDDWLGDVSDYDWSEHAAERAERGHATPPREGLVAVVDDSDRATTEPVDAAEARRATVERRRIVAGLAVAAVLGIVIVIALVLLRGGNEAPAPEADTTTLPATTTPSATTETPAQGTPSQESTTPQTPDTGASATTPSTEAGTSFTLPEGTKLRLDEGDPALVEKLQQALIDAGYDPGSVDGSFGPTTEAAVTAFQQDNGLSADGVVGPDTASALNSALSAG